MLERQEYLDFRYSFLRDGRSGPVFFIEHGLPEADVDTCFADVRAAAARHPLEDPWWDGSNLPLLLVASEVGYRYRGSGTDFWPMLEGEFGTSLSTRARRSLRDMFVSAASRFRGARPPGTPWARAFHLIAWPITHALIPLEFHRPLALALSKLRIHADDLDDEALHRFVQLASRNPSVRYTTLLDSAERIVPVVRSLLGSHVTDLSTEITQRIADDLAADRVAQRGVELARLVQRASRPAREQTREAAPDAAPAIRGALQLRRREQDFALEASFPPIGPELSTRLRFQLRRRRYSPKLWGVAARLPGERLVCGLPFQIRVVSAPPEDTDLLPDLDTLDIDDDLRDLLGRLELEISAPLLFAIGSSGDIARRVKGPTVSGNRSYWALTVGCPAALAGRVAIGQVGPYSVYHLDPRDERQEEALSTLGFEPRFGVSLTFAGAPNLDPYGLHPRYLKGDALFVASSEAAGREVTVELDGDAVRVSSGALVEVKDAEGEKILRARTATDSRDFAFEVLPGPAAPPARACAVEVQSPELTVQELINGRLAFKISSIVGLEGLTLTAEIRIGAETKVASARLGPLPQVVTSHHEPLRTLLDEATTEYLLQQKHTSLGLRVGAMCSGTWTLESRVSACWWEHRGEREPVLMSDLGELAHGVVTARQPHVLPRPEPVRGADVSLLAPVDLDVSEYGPAASFTTFCTAPQKVPLTPPRIDRPRLRRRLRSAGSGLGLADLVESYLRWSLAESENLVAELRRRQIAGELDGWITEVCCGREWRDRELKISQKRPRDMLVTVAQEHGLGRDSYVAVPDSEWDEVLEIAIDMLDEEFPELWSFARAPNDLAESDWLTIEQACDSAYQILSARRRQAGCQELADALAGADASADFDPRKWQAAFDVVLFESDLLPVASLLQPTDTTAYLIGLDISDMSVADIGSELTQWASKNSGLLSGDPATKEAGSVLVSLWAEPANAVHMNWREALGVVVCDRVMARAARYLALRVRQSRQMNLT